MSETTTQDSASRTGSLTALRLPQLQEMAAGLGIKGYRRLRKSELIDAIKNSQGSGASTAAAKKSAPAATEPTASASVAEDGQSAPKRRSSRRSAAADTAAPAAAAAPEAAQAPAAAPAADTAPAAEFSSADSAPAASAGTTEPSATSTEEGEAQQGENQRSRRSRSRRGGESRNDGAEIPESEDREDRGNGRRGRGGDDSERGNDRSERGGRGNDRRSRQGDDSDRGNSDRGNDRRSRQGDDSDREDRGNGRRGRGGDDTDRRSRGGDDDDRGNRRGRGRDRKRRGRGDEPEIRSDDVLIPVGGILDVHDNYAFLRTSGYLPGPNDVYVSASMVRKNGLRKGDAVAGAIRQQRDNDRSGKREKFDALVRLDSVNGLSVDDARSRVEFSKLTPLYPQERLRLETGAKITSTRLIDLVTPIGKGQRGLIVAPPKAGKTTIMQQVANAITANNPDVHLMVVLVDERPEEVTDMQRAVQGEVIASTFDRPADDHTTIAELAIERAKRLVEMGSNVVVLLDNITRLARAYNIAQPASGRILSGGVDANALYPPKKFFGAARNIEGGGSLTILATALVETGSKMDEVIFEEFKGTGNMELRLSRHLADKRIFPAIDVNSSSTRREEMLMTPEETKVMWKLRRLLSGLEQQQAVELLMSKLKETGSNAEFLMQVQKTTPLPKSSTDD